MRRGRVEEGVRAGVVLVGLVGLVSLGLGLGGVWGRGCVLRPLEETEGGGVRLRTCERGQRGETELVLAQGYFPMDALFGELGGGRGTGVGAVETWRLSAAFRAEAGPLRALQTTPEDVLVSNALLPKAALLLGAVGWAGGLFLLLSLKQMLCELNPAVGTLEGLVAVVGGVVGLAAGLLAVLAGTFAHVSEEELRQAGLSDLLCPGWLAGGVLLISAALLQLALLLLHRLLPPISTPHPPHSASLHTYHTERPAPTPAAPGLKTPDGHPAPQASPANPAAPHTNPRPDNHSPQAPDNTRSDAVTQLTKI